MSGWLKDKEHLARMAGLFAVGVLGFFVLRYFLVPPGFGLYGHYRAGALDDAAARPLHFAGRSTCEACHTDIVAARKGSRHERIACETCHGGLIAHATAAEAVKPVRPDTRTLCVRCHQASAWKPRAFPQINVAEHSADGPCTACHQPHAPKMS